MGWNGAWKAFARRWGRLKKRVRNSICDLSELRMTGAVPSEADLEERAEPTGARLDAGAPGLAGWR